MRSWASSAASSVLALRAVEGIRERVDGSHDGYGALIGVAAKIKSSVNIPVGCVDAMDARMVPDPINLS